MQKDIGRRITVSSLLHLNSITPGKMGVKFSLARRCKVSRELGDDSGDLAAVCGDRPEPPPVVGFDFEVAKRVHAGDGAAEVADEDV